MNISEFFISRPVFATIINIFIIIAGIMSFNNLKVREYPEVLVPQFTISAHYPNTSALVVESSLTSILEDALAGLPDLGSMSSRSDDSYSNITLKFKNGANLDSCLSNIREYIAKSQYRLPKEVKTPSIVMGSRNYNDAFLFLSLSSESLNPGELYHLADTQIKNVLRSIKGVARVEIWGQPYIMRVTLDSKKSLSVGVEPNEIINILEQYNQTLSAGKFRDLVYTTIRSSLNDLKSFENLVIKNLKSKPVFLKDIAKIELTTNKDNFRVIIDGKQALMIAITKSSYANPLELSNLISLKLKEIEKNLPSEVKIDIAEDTTKFIRASLFNIKSSIIEALILVVVIIFLFLNNIRSCLIPVLTIPISLVGSFAIMSIFGLSINVITLLAMVLAVGLVVDDAIVVLENIHKYLEKGESALQASIKGSKEITFSIISMTLTLASVYIPMIFIKDAIGQIFSEFAITLAGSVIISGITALTLSPMMCSRLLKPHNLQKSNKISLLILKLEHLYQKILSIVLNNTKYVTIITLLIVYIAAHTYLKLPREIAPKEDRGIVGIFINHLAGKNIDTTEDNIKKLETIVRENISEPGKIFGFMGDWGGNLVLVMPEHEARTKSASEIVGILRKKTKVFPSVDVNVWSIDNGMPNIETQSNRDSSDISVMVLTTDSYLTLSDNLSKFKKELEKTGLFSNIYHDLSMNNPGYDLQIDPIKLQNLGLSRYEVSQIVRLYFGGINPISFRIDTAEYDLQLKTDIKPWSVDEIYLTTKYGKRVSLGAFAKLESSINPPTLNHYNQTRSANLTMTPINPKKMQDNIAKIKEIKDQILSNNFKIEFVGSSKDLKESSNIMMILIILSLIFIYGVMAIQFESYLDPFIIMLSVPMSCFGAFLLLIATDQSINVFTQIGIITLVGLITKHGILIVDFANKLVKEGGDLVVCVKLAAISRFRPILMTSFAMILGSLPLIISSGAGSEARKAIGYVLVGGLSFGTLLTLFVIPCFYIMFKNYQITNVNLIIDNNDK